MVKTFAWYPADDEQKRFKRRKPGTAKLRKNIQPGQVLILLAGRFRGKRVVFLKQLESGLLLVTGPYKVNGVPLKRVNQVYTIATSTKVDVSGVKADAVNDAWFKFKKTKKTAEEKFFAADAKKKNEISGDRVSKQKEVDGALLNNLKDKTLKNYLNSRFTLSKNTRPHELKF